MTVDELFPIVSTADLDRLLPFYRDVLGGQVAYQFPAEGTPDYAGLRFGRSTLGLGRDPGLAPATGGSTNAGSPTAGVPIALWLYVDDLEAVVEAIRSAGSRIVSEPTDQPWGEREARVEDPDGNQLILGQRHT